MTFPEVTGTDLLGVKVAFPADMGTLPALVVVAFDQKQRDDVESWLPFIAALEERGRVRGRLLAVLSGGMKLLRGAILKAARGAAANDAQRASSILAFTDVDAFCAALDISDRHAVGVYLVLPGGAVAAHANGPFDPAAGTRLEQRLSTPA